MSYPSPRAMWMVTGRIDTLCNHFSFRNFPFDKLKCTMVFAADEPVNFTQFYIERFLIDPSAKETFISHSEVWHLEDPISHIVANQVEMAGSYSRLYFTITFKREPEYFIASIIIPTIALALVQHILFFIPLEIPQRPAIATSIVLSYTVLFSLVYSKIPRTSEPVYLVIIVMSHFVGGIIITIYSILAIPLSRKIGKKKVSLGRWEFELISLINSAFGFSCSLAFIILDACLFNKMMFYQ